jgi:replicative DNA helicase
MSVRVLNELYSIREQLSEILDNHSDKLIESTRSRSLKEELQTNVIDMMSQTIDEIDKICDNIEGNDYNQSNF